MFLRGVLVVRAADGTRRAYTLCHKFDYECRFPKEDGQKVAEYNREFLIVIMSSHYRWQSDTYLVGRLRSFLQQCIVGLRRVCGSETAAEVIRFLHEVVRDGHVIAMPGDKVEPHQSGSNPNAQESPCPRSATVTPSSLYRRTSLAAAKPFHYTPAAISADVEELAASTNNPRFAARMLGYDYKTFGTMLHKFKDANGLRPSDNSIFHDNGDVEFNGRIFQDSIHDYAP
ncbi:hypothetical protein PQQ51_14695 [Paraburkholderia xenovorans]|uniref:hypothetical protein n=1 Tax=Paraburkholderia xenovorans TaxID=36873 RepID=UPI0038BB7ADF